MVKKYYKLILVSAFFVLLISVIAAYMMFFSNNRFKQTGSSINKDSNPIETSETIAVVNINTSKNKTLEIGMTGFHSERTGAPYSLIHPKSIKQVNEYNKLGFIRNAGTNISTFNWRTGNMDEEMLGQYYFDPVKYYNFAEHARLLPARGYETMEDLREFLQKTGTKLNMAVNPFFNTPESVGDLAKYCYDNHMPVTYFDLGNEVYMYTAEAGFSRPFHFKTGEDYLDRMRLYDKAIKANYPGAKTVAAMSNDQNRKFDEDFKNYNNPYWDAVAIHKFNGDGDTVDAAIKSANETFDKWIGQINANYIPRLPDPKTPILLQEHSVALGGRISNTHYNGIVVAENTLRFSMHPNIQYTQSWRLQGGLSNVDENVFYAYKLHDANQRNLTIDTNKWSDMALTESITALSLRVVDGAINQSNMVWETKVSGGASVPRNTGKIPALYAQAYRGMNGKDYVVIVNKSGTQQEVYINRDGALVKSPMTIYYYANSNPAARDDDQRPKEAAAQNPIIVPGYSVTRVEWVRTNKPDVPPVPWLSHADAGVGQVDLKWLRVINAEGYKIRYGTEPEKLSTEIDAGNNESISIRNLKNGTRYYFAVSAYNKSGAGKYSNEVIQNGIKVNEVSIKLDKPETPVIRKVYPERSSRLIVEWQSVSGASGYKLIYGTSPGSYSEEKDIGNNIGYIVNGLENGKTYYFAVTAYNAVGESLNSKEMSGVPVKGLPLAPNKLEMTFEAPDSVKLKWIKTKSEQFTDDFEGSGPVDWNPVSGSWNVTEHPDKERETKVYKSMTDGKAISIFQVGNPKEDQVLEVTIENAKGAGTSQVGIVGRYTDINNYYKFVYVADNNTFQIAKVQDGQETVLKSVAAGKVNTDIMALQLHFDGDEITAEYGARNVVTLKDSSFKEGYSGLYTTQMESVFDKVRLKSDNAGFINIYRSEHPYDGFVKIKSIPGSELTFTDDIIPDPDKKYYYRVKAESDAGESYGYSNTVRKK